MVSRGFLFVLRVFLRGVLEKRDAIWWFFVVKNVVSCGRSVVDGGFIFGG